MKQIVFIVLLCTICNFTCSQSYQGAEKDTSKSGLIYTGDTGKFDADETIKDGYENQPKEHLHHFREESNKAQNDNLKSEYTNSSTEKSNKELRYSFKHRRRQISGKASVTLVILLAALGFALFVMLVTYLWYTYKPKMNGYIRMVINKDQQRSGQTCYNDGYTALDMVEEEQFEETQKAVIGDKPDEESGQHETNKNTCTGCDAGDKMEHHMGDSDVLSIKGNSMQRCEPASDKKIQTNRSTSSGKVPSNPDNYIRQEVAENKKNISIAPFIYGDIQAERSFRRWSQPSWKTSVKASSNNNNNVREKEKTMTINQRNSSKKTPSKWREDLGEVDSDYDTNYISTDSDSQSFRAKHTFRRRSQPSWRTMLQAGESELNHKIDDNDKGSELTIRDSRLGDMETTDILFLAESINLGDQCSETLHKRLKLDMNMEDGREMNDSREELMKQWMKSRRKSTRASVYCVSSESDDDYVEKEDDIIVEKEMETNSCKSERLSGPIIYFNYLKDENSGNENWKTENVITENIVRKEKAESLEMKDRLTVDLQAEMETREDFDTDNHDDSEDEFTVATESNYFEIAERDAIKLMSDELLQDLMICGSTMVNRKNLLRSKSDSELSKFKYEEIAGKLTAVSSFSTSNLRSKTVLPVPETEDKKKAKPSKHKRIRRSFSKKLKNFRKLFGRHRKKTK